MNPRGKMGHGCSTREDILQVGLKQIQMMRITGREKIEKGYETLL